MPTHKTFQNQKFDLNQFNKPAGLNLGLWGWMCCLPIVFPSVSDISGARQLLLFGNPGT